ncbi:MAG: hypothetical protein JSU72_05795 [Deltaproteobacteria bacterium]|nr:MAG: hypothetical protein JSU72_05795 [Deltaproteobacteria bacterium]
MKLQNSIGPSIVFVCLVLLTTIVVSSTLSTKVYAASEAQILAQAKAEYTASQDLVVVITNTVDAAMESGIALDEISAPLAEMLMSAGLELGKDGTSLAGSISEHILSAAIKTSANHAAVLWTVHHATQGIRAAAAGGGLDEKEVRAQIERSLHAAAPSADFAKQLGRLVDATYKQSHATTYSDAAMPGAEIYTAPESGPPAAPSSPPPGVGDMFDNTASSS